MANNAEHASPLAPLGREEYIEQAHFFRALAERLEVNVPAQEVLASVREETLATTKLPLPRRRRLAQRRPPTPRPRLRLLAPRLLRPPLLAKLGVISLLDAPCGDAGWISRTRLGVTYVGIDIVPDLIVEGCVLLAGKPKHGKSWFVLDVGLAVASARYCLGDKKCEEGDVLYLALEDGDRRLQRRITKLLPTFGGKWPERFNYETKWPRENEGGIEAIDAWCYVVRGRTLRGAGPSSGDRPER